MLFHDILKCFFSFYAKNQTISAIYVSFFINQKIGSLSKSLGIPDRVKFFGRTLVRAQGGSCHNCHRERLEEEAEDHLNWTWNRCFLGGGDSLRNFFWGGVSSKWCKFSKVWKFSTRFVFFKLFATTHDSRRSWILGSEIFKTDPFLASSGTADCTWCYVYWLPSRGATYTNLWNTSRK